MDIITRRIKVTTKGSSDFIDITPDIRKILASTKFEGGVIFIFVIGSTAAITTFEYEPALISDMRDIYEKLVPKNGHYEHDDTWGDANGFSHIRAALQGPSLIVPFQDGKLLTGRWQQIILAEFDTRPREREIVVQLIGR